MTSSHKHSSTGRVATAGDTDARLAALEAKAHTHPVTVPPPSSNVLLDTRVDGWGKFGQFSPPGDPGDKQDCYYSDSLSRAKVNAAGELVATIVKSPRTFPGDGVPVRPYGGVQLGTRDTFSCGPSANGTKIAFTVNYPFVQGLYIAVWLLGEKLTLTPPEIDTMEHPMGSGGNPRDVAGWVNWYGVAGSGNAVKDTNGLYTGQDWTGADHSWETILYPTHMDFLVDGVKKGSATKMPQIPMALLIEAGVGGPRGSTHHADATTPDSIPVLFKRVMVETLP